MNDPLGMAFGCVFNLVALGVWWLLAIALNRALVAGGMPPSLAQANSVVLGGAGVLALALASSGFLVEKLRGAALREHLGWCGRLWGVFGLACLGVTAGYYLLRPVPLDSFWKSLLLIGVWALIVFSGLNALQRNLERWSAARHPARHPNPAVSQREGEPE